MLTQGPVPAEVYRQCFEHSPWPSLLVDRTLLRVVDANRAAAGLLPEPGADPIQAGPELDQVLIFEEALEPLPSGRMILARPCRQSHFFPCLVLPLNAGMLMLQLMREPGSELDECINEIEKLQRLNQRKSELIGNISHELRTPMTAILGWPEILLDSEDMPPLATQAALSIRKDGLFLKQLLDDLIDLSRIEAGKLTLEIQSQDMVRIVLDAVEMLAEKAHKKGLALETQLPEHEIWVMADGMRILQVVINYLSNSIKYTDRGHISIKLETTAEEAVLSLQDTGIGMSEDVRRQVFERFVRADEVQSTDGAGIGLSVVKKLVELHGGRCWVESAPGQGSTFYVSLMLAQSEDQVSGQAQMPSGSSLRRLTQTRLLILDEHPEELSLLSRLLDPYFHQVDAESVLPPVAELLALEPDLVLLSTSLSAAHHQDWMRALRADQSLAGLPVVALSASAMKGDAEQLLALGYSGCLSKPFLKEDLLQYIQHLLTRTSLNPTL